MVANKTKLESNLIRAYNTTCALIQLQKNHVFITHNDNVDIGLDEVKEEIEIISKFLDNGKKVIIVDIRNIKSLDRAAREHYKSFLEENMIAVGIIIDNPISRMIGNVVMGFNKPKNVSMKLFTNIEEATQWTTLELENFVKQNKSLE